MFNTTKQIISKLDAILNYAEIANQRGRVHGDKLRSIDSRTTQIAQREAQTEVRGTFLPREGDYISESTLAKLRTQLGMPQRETNPGAYPHKLEAEYTAALRRYYEFHNGPYDGPMDQPSYAYPSPPSESMGDQAGWSSGVATSLSGNLSMAQSTSQVSSNEALAYYSNAVETTVPSVRNFANALIPVATDELFGYSGVRPVQEG